MPDKLQRARHIKPRSAPAPTEAPAPRARVRHDGGAKRAARPAPREGRAVVRDGEPGAGAAPAAPLPDTNNPRWLKEARELPARGRHRGSDKTLVNPPTDPGATGLIPVVGAHAGLDRTIPSAVMEQAIRQQEVLAVEEAAAPGALAAETAVPDADARAESVGASAALISICVIASRITGFARTWAMAFALGSTFVSSSYQVANNLPNMLYELVMGGMLITAFLPVYLSVKKQLGRERGNEYASNLLTIVARGSIGALCRLRRPGHLHPELLLEPG